VQAFLNGTSAAILDGHNVPQYCGTGNIRGSQRIFPASSCPNFPGRQQDQAASADPDLGGSSRTHGISTCLLSPEFFAAADGESLELV
jgi:hypothetical protein